MNRANASSIISKQECMVELTGLPLVLCSETIENVNISGAMRIKTGNHDNMASTILLKYQDRPEVWENLSFCEYFHVINNRDEHEKIVIPHFIGMSSTPTYPVTTSYARATLIIHKPWRHAYFHKLSDADCIQEFSKSIKNKTFPASVIMTYEKVKLQHSENRAFVEPVQRTETFESDDHGITQEEAELIRLMSSLTANMGKSVNINGTEYNRGADYDWSRRIYNVSSKYTLYMKRI